VSGDLLGAAEIFKIVEICRIRGGEIKNGGGEKFEEVRG
jgi:hypothetical protein